jgi:glutamyl-tRNA reductase
MQKKLASFKGLSNHYLDYFCVYQGVDAIKHLYNVACGIHSMILGEDEILRQVKDSFAVAQGINSTGYQLNTIVKGAISCAKKIKTQTKLSSTPVSVGTLTANEIFSLNVPKKTVLIIGATGKAGSIVMKNLLCGKDIDIVATIRNHNALFDYTSQYPNVKFIDYHERYHYMDFCDVVISATSSPHYTVTQSRLLPELKTPKNRLFLDLAVPQDIDTSITEIPNVTLKNIDYFKTLSQQNNLTKLQEVEKAKLIIEDEVENILKELAMHEFLPYMDSLKEYVTAHGVESLIFKLKTNSDSQTLKNMLEYLKAVIL